MNIFIYFYFYFDVFTFYICVLLLSYIQEKFYGVYLPVCVVFEPQVGQREVDLSTETPNLMALVVG